MEKKASKPVKQKFLTLEQKAHYRKLSNEYYEIALLYNGKSPEKFKRAIELSDYYTGLLEQDTRAIAQANRQ